MTVGTIFRIKSPAYSGQTPTLRIAGPHHPYRTVGAAVLLENALGDHGVHALGAVYGLGDIEIYSYAA